MPRKVWFGVLFLALGILTEPTYSALAPSTSNTSGRIWVASPSGEYAVSLSSSNWLVNSVETWEHDVPHQIIEKLDFKHVKGGMLWVDVWKNSLGLDLDMWMVANQLVLPFTAAAAESTFATSFNLPAYRHRSTVSIQSYEMVQTLFEFNGKVYLVSYLDRGSADISTDYDELISGMTFIPASDWQDAALLQQQAASAAIDPHLMVYACGGEQDTCPCGASNPFPCCNYGNCTWYAWHRACCDWDKNIPPRGNAGAWAPVFMSNPDYEVTTSPQVGDVAMNNTSACTDYYKSLCGGICCGHVAFVTGVSGSTITVMEQGCDSYSTRTTTYNKSFFQYYARPKPVSGNLKVTINPAEARTAGAQWRRTGTSTWRNSDYTETGLSPGSKTVEFKDVTSWDKPANASVTVSAGQTATMTKSYVRHTGSLTVTINPADARTAGAQWRRTGTTTWRNSGTTESSINTGTYTVEFNALSSPWIKPANISVSITKNATTSPSVRYNRPPVLSAPGSNFVHVGSQLQFSLAATDADGDAITYSMSSAPSGSTLTSGVFRFMPTPVQAGATYIPSFTATDALGATDSETATIKVGSPPVISPIAAQRAKVGELHAIDVYASEPDGDVISLSISNAPGGATFDPGNGLHGVFSFTPMSTQGGEVHSIVFKAGDPDGSHALTVPLIVGAPPVLGTLEDVAVTAGQTTTFTVTASDPNNDVKTFSMSGAPTSATLTGSGNTRTFSYTGQEADKGLAFDITFEVSETDGQDTTSMQLRVQGPPEFSDVPPQRVVVGNLLELAIIAVDPDGDAMSFSVSNAPPSSGFATSASGGVLSYTPPAEAGGLVYTAQFYAVAEDGVSVMEVPITVGVLPEITVPGPFSVAEYNTLEFEVTATDVNGDSLELAASPMPPNSTFDSNGATGTFHFVPASYQGGLEYSITFSAADGIDGADEKDVAIRVIDDDMYEQNDDMESATDFNPYRGMTRPARQSDDDWYEINLPLGRQRLVAAAQFLGEQGGMSITLYNAQGVEIGQSVATAAGADLDVGSPFFGTHYLLVRGDDNGNGYTLGWDHADSWNGCDGSDDPYATNSTQEAAVSLASGVWLSDMLGVGIAGVPDWYKLDVPAGEEFLNITVLYGQWDHPLRLELYDPDGVLVGTADGSDGLLEWSGSLRSHGLHAIKVSSINDPACIPYNLMASTEARDNLAVEFLSGNFLQIPVETVGGRWLGIEPSEGARFNTQGTGGFQGVDMWGGAPAVVNHVIAKGGNTILTNGSDWFVAPVITRLSEGTWNRLAMEGQPFDGLVFRRELSFEDNDRVVAVIDRLINQSVSPISSIITMESVNPTPDYGFSELRTSNDVSNGDIALVVASSIRSGMTVALGSVDPMALADASFLSRLNPYTVVSSPGDPNGAVANLSIKLAMNHGTMAPGQTNESRWYLVFGGDTADVRDQFDVAVMRDAAGDDTFEPNNESASASNVSGQSNLRAVQADDDWYAIELPIGAQDLSVSLRFAPAHGSMEVSLLTAEGQVVCESEPTEYGAALTCIAPAYGTVYLKVDGKNSGNVYDLEWSSGSSWGGCGTVPDDSLEPNDSRDQAAALPSGISGAIHAGSMLVAGDDDWYMLDVTPGYESLVVTCTYYTADGDLALGLYDHVGNLLHSVDTTSNHEILAYTVPAEGRYFLRVSPPAAGATCNLYDVLWSGTSSATSVTDSIYLYGNYLFLPIRTTEEPGRFLAAGQAAGLRYDRAGISGFTGIDLWRQLTLPSAHYIAWGGAHVVTNGKNWVSGPVVEKLSSGSMNHAKISGSPAAGLRFERNVRFNDDDLVITVEDVLVNEGASSITQLLTMDTFNPNPDYDQGIVNKRHFVTAVYDHPEISLAEALQCGITLALGSVSPYVVPDASFISRQNPYTVLGSPNQPVGLEANYSLKLLLNYGTLAPSASVTGVWQIVAGENRADALMRWQASLLNHTGSMDANLSGLPDWWEVAYFNGPTDPLADPDSDGANNRDELFAGTDPNDPSSVFRVFIHKEPVGPLLPSVRWEVYAGRKATLLQGTNLLGPFWPVPGTSRDPGEHSYTDRLDQVGGSVFYILQLDEPNE